MRLTKQKVGWIGVDVGTTTIKIAQVARNRHGWQLAASAIVPRQHGVNGETSQGKKVVSSRDELQAAKSLQDGYQGRKVAAALPMSLCDVHRFDRDLSRETNPQNILRQTIETATQHSIEGLQYGFWSAPATESKPAWSQALTVPRDWTDQLCEDIAQVGWNCEAIDGQPLAIARAMNMVQQAAPDEPVAGLDWGSGGATLCFLENRQPSYVRTLKLCGLVEILHGLTEQLQISTVEAQRLLEEHGVASAANRETTEIANLVTEIVANHLATLVEELKRSFSHFQYVRRMSRPNQLYLLGGGAMIKGLDEELTARLDLPTKNWHLPTRDEQQNSEDARTESLLASAIALSALAWEQA